MRHVNVNDTRQFLGSESIWFEPSCGYLTLLRRRAAPSSTILHQSISDFICSAQVPHLLNYNGRRYTVAIEGRFHKVINTCRDDVSNKELGQVSIMFLDSNTSKVIISLSSDWEYWYMPAPGHGPSLWHLPWVCGNVHKQGS
jgi:hypothetical protein